MVEQVGSVDFTFDHKTLADKLLHKYQIFLTGNPKVARMLARSVKGSDVVSVKWGNANDFDEVPSIYKYDDLHYYACVIAFKAESSLIHSYYEIIFT